MKKLTVLFLICIFVFAIAGCSKDDSTDTSKKSGQIVETEEDSKPAQEDKISDAKPQAGGNLVSCGNEYNAGNLSFNVYGVSIREDGDEKHLVLNVEIFNNSSEDIEFNPMMTLALFNENDEECSWNVMIGKLSGVITANNKIKGDVAFEITGIETDSYILNIGDNFEYKKAIEITSSDIDMTYPEIFEGSGVDSEYNIGIPVTSDVFDMMVSEASIIPSDKEGKEILLINLSITNNDSESRALSFEIAGVFTSEGEKLDTEVTEWTFTRNNIESGDTQTGIVSYYVEEGIRDFYMTVKPDITDFSNSSNIVFSVE